ncbi:hypothetical protein TIFTF001_022388 [Ficus carica]|uniref:Uncharacterized protein n=1 Tax=Ficus carica TaxID=3494 RepID=A0AA88DJZ5_FICCA|nr:hypothetical protein TIFTF001_022388 [Ficus carica]
MNFHNMYGARESKRERETYQFHECGCVWRGSRVCDGDWRREREGGAREKMEGRVVAEIGGKVKRERCEREWREESRLMRCF